MKIKRLAALMMAGLLIGSNALAGEYITYAELKEELSGGWHETIGKKTVDIDFNLPDTDTLAVLKVSPRPPVDDALLERYVPDAQENICNDPGHIFQFYNGPEDNRKSYVIQSAHKGNEDFGTVKPDKAFQNGMTFDSLLENLDAEMQYLWGEKLNDQDWEISYEVGHYVGMDSMQVTANQVIRGLNTPYHSMLCMQTWDRDYYYFWMMLWQEDQVVVEDLPLSSLERVKEDLRKGLKNGDLLNVEHVGLEYKPFKQENGDIWLIPVWCVWAETDFHGMQPTFCYYYSAQTGKEMELEGYAENGYLMQEHVMEYDAEPHFHQK